MFDPQMYKLKPNPWVMELADGDLGGGGSGLESKTSYVRFGPLQRVPLRALSLFLPCEDTFKVEMGLSQILSLVAP